MALIAYTLFLLIVVIGRIILQYRTTGDHGLRPVTAKSSMLPKLTSALLMVSFAATFSLSCLEALGKFNSQLHLGATGTITGILFCAIGIIVSAISQYQMGTAWRIGVDVTEKTELVTHGLYSYARNPIYSGVILFGFGLLILIPHTYMLLSLFIGYLSIELQVRYVEEPYLIRLHGTAYESYAKKVNRYFPMCFIK